jgi:DNA repair protein RadC
MQPEHKPKNSIAKREELLNHLKNFSDYELLKTALLSSYDKEDNILARKLLEKFGSLKKVLQADFRSLENIEEIDDNDLISLKILNEIVVRCSKTNISKQPIISNWKYLYEYCQISMANLSKEQFIVLFLDKTHRLIGNYSTKNNKVDDIKIDINKIAKRAIIVDAKSIILIHNHPNKNSSPSPMDIKTTKQIVDLFKKINIKLYDHLIVGKNCDIFSFKANHLL